MESKKISFGFSKIGKKVNLQAGPAATGPVSVKGTTVDFIDCLEGQSIKIIGKDQEDDKPKPLVIPLREQDKTTIPGRLAKLLHIKEEKASALSPKSEPEPERNGSEPTVKQEPIEGEILEQRAAREILADLEQLKKEPTDASSAFVVPLKPEELPLDGARESTLDDYESIPVERFGMAMLRGMGFKEDPAAKKDSKLPQEGPVQRPKGLGLGADRGMKSKPLLIPPAKDETLIMKRGAQVKVLAGKHKDTYGTIESMDEETGRVVLKFALGGAYESLNEYMVQLVSRLEYSKYSKILNSGKYEEFKNRSMGTQPEEASSSSNERRDQKQHNHRTHSPTRSKESPKHRNDRKVDSKRSVSTGSKRKDESRPRNDRQHRRDVDSFSSHSASPTRQSSESDTTNNRRRDKSTSSYVRTSSNTKKKSHKYKQRRHQSRERRHSSESDDKHHKKKTKKSKKQRSRSRSRR